MRLDEVERERVVAGRHRRVRGEDRRAPHFLERRRRTTRRARSGRECAAGRRTRRALRSGARPPASMPIALSARTPPMPRMISCWTRVSRSPPYRRADSSRSQGAFSSRSVSSRYSFTRPSRTRHTEHEHAAVAERHGDDARLAVGRDRRLDRRAVPGQALVRFLLPAFGRDALVEVALRIHEADADERHAEVARFLAVIAGEHAEAAGVDRQRLVQRELRGEVRDRPLRVGIAVLPPGVAARRAPRRARRWRRRRPTGTARRWPPRSSMLLRHERAASGPGCAPSDARAGSRAAGRHRAPAGSRSTTDRSRVRGVGAGVRELRAQSHCPR